MNSWNNSMKVSVVIPNYNGERYLKECLISLKAQTFTDFEIILVDNASQDGSLTVARDIIPNIICIELTTNSGFSAAVNCGIKRSKGTYVVLLNNDTLLKETWLYELVSCMESNPKAFSCASKMIQYHQRDLLDNAGDTMTLFGWAYQEGHGNPISMYNENRQIFTACAGAAIYRKRLFEEIGYFDEHFFAYLEDVDIGYRARIMGYTNIYCANAILYHIGSATTGNGYNAKKVNLSARNNVYLIYKNMTILQIILNSPFILLGYIFKFYFYKKIGFLEDYSAGIREGFIGRKKLVKTGFELKNINHYFSIQYWLVRKGIEYGLNKISKILAKKG